MPFAPRFVDGHPFSSPLGKVVCVGRNYAEHARELDNPVPKAPILFIKPASSVVALDEPVDGPFARSDVHFETELALLIGEPLTDATPEQAERAVVGVGLALDLTLRDVQSELKKKGHPWEIAKAFDGACPLSRFVAVDEVPQWSALTFTLDIEGERRQHGVAGDMLFPIPALLAEMSRHFTLAPGDVVLTGTPAGVGVLEPGTRLTFSLSLGEGEALALETRVAERA
ncbi:fumarylacetoacetate hydrolase family protein [Halomonas sp. V046]|uniref:fumarylacetoacetate hydrolase family protein n=1 Tax=Halomonas sp. V046 TaxID=3459611 RepID=UPI004044F61B